MPMARTSASSPAPAKKEPGRIRQMWQVYKMTRRYDPQIVWWLALGFVVPAAAGITVAFTISQGNVIAQILYIVAGVFGGVLAVLIILGRRAERAAYSQIEGQPGAVGAVLKSGLRGTWTGNEIPVAVSPKTQDAVYRAVGKGGVVLIGEGPKSRTARMLEEERRNVTRVVGTVPVNVLHVGPDPDSVPLHRIPRSLRRFKRVLTRAEITAVSNRLNSISRGQAGIGIPKGIDPMRVRAPRPR